MVAVSLKKKEHSKTPKDIFKFIVMHGIGMLLTGLLWANLDSNALTGGLIWASIGFVYLLFITRGLRKKVVSVDESQPVTGFNKVITEDDLKK